MLGGEEGRTGQCKARQHSALLQLTPPCLAAHPSPVCAHLVPVVEVVCGLLCGVGERYQAHAKQEEARQQCLLLQAGTDSTPALVETPS